MSLVLQCQHLATSGTLRYCMNGKFPCDCEACDCKDKKYINVITTAGTDAWPNYLKDK